MKFCYYALCHLIKPYLESMTAHFLNTVFFNHLNPLASCTSHFVVFFLHFCSLCTAFGHETFSSFWGRAVKVHPHLKCDPQTGDEVKRLREQCSHRSSLKHTHAHTLINHLRSAHLLNLNLIFSTRPIISSLSHNALPASSPHPVPL